MRSDQYVGLTERAKVWLDKYAVKETTDTLTVASINGVETKRYSNTVVGHAYTEYAHIEGAWSDNVGPLLRYKLPDGREVEEYVQETTWSSGPMYFLALRYTGKEPCTHSCECFPAIANLAWTDAEIRLEP